MKTRVALLAVLLFSSFMPEFQAEYQSASNFIQSNYKRYARILEEKNVEADLALSVVFPEIIRYSKFKDFFETQALSQFYINGANVDFSIGYFQMKPSFAQKLEKYVLADSLLKKQFHQMTYAKQLTEKEIRKERIERLKNEEWQLTYLSCFMLLSARNIPVNYSKVDQLRIHSTSYNYKHEASLLELKKWAEKKTYPYGPKAPAEIQYSYAEVSAFFYTNTLPNLKKQIK